MSCQLPTEQAVVDSRKFDEEKGEVGGYGGQEAKVQVVQRINHDGEINRARCVCYIFVCVCVVCVVFSTYIYIYISDTCRRTRA